MKILVFGAGVLGCNLARNFFRAGKDVTLLRARQLGGGNSKERPAHQGQIFAAYIGQPHLPCPGRPAEAPPPPTM